MIDLEFDTAGQARDLLAAMRVVWGRVLRRTSEAQAHDMPAGAGARDFAKAGGLEGRRESHESITRRTRIHRVRFNDRRASLARAGDRGLDESGHRALPSKRPGHEKARYRPYRLVIIARVDPATKTLIGRSRRDRTPHDGLPIEIPEETDRHPGPDAPFERGLPALALGLLAFLRSRTPHHTPAVARGAPALEQSFEITPATRADLVKNKPIDDLRYFAHTVRRNDVQFPHMMAVISSRE